MSNRQEFLDRVRDLQTDIKTRLDKGKFTKRLGIQLILQLKI